MTLPRAYAFIGSPSQAGHPSRPREPAQERRPGLGRPARPAAAGVPGAPSAPRLAGDQGAVSERQERVWEQRRALGRRLASLRSRAGFSQWEFAPLTGYSRSTLSDAELGRHRLRREFWMRCDEALSVGGALVTAYDQIEAVAAVVRRKARIQAQRTREEQASQRLKALLPAGAEAEAVMPAISAVPVVAADAPPAAVEQCPHCHQPVTIMIVAAPAAAGGAP